MAGIPHLPNCRCVSGIPVPGSQDLRHCYLVSSQLVQETDNVLVTCDTDLTGVLEPDVSNYKLKILLMKRLKPVCTY